MMVIPHNINKNTFKCYEIFKISKSHEENIKSYDFTEWCAKTPESLRIHSIKCIARNWIENPITLDSFLCSDRCLLLDFLPINIPLKLAVQKLEDDYYWEKRYKQYWPKYPIPNKQFPDYFSEKINENCLENNGILSNENRLEFDNKISKISTLKNCKEKTWKQCFLEQYFRETLENLKPENYDLEMINDLISICQDFIFTLSIRQLQAQEKSSGKIDHIPLNIVISKLRFLTELSICFKQTYLRENFSWDAFRVSPQDIKLLGKGLENCNLYSMRIQNSDIECVKIKMLFEPLLKNENLRVLNLSHCKISDEGSLIICKLALKHASLNEIILTNNKIGCNGAKYFAILLCQKECKLSHLDLKLNKIGETGGNFIFEGLLKGAIFLKELNLAACCLRKENWPIGMIIAKNSVLEVLDISNNKIGEEIGLNILEGLKRNKTIINLDIRMCGLTSDTEKLILDEINKNRKGFTNDKIVIERDADTETKEIEDIFNNIQENDKNILNNI